MTHLWVWHAAQWLRVWDTTGGMPVCLRELSSHAPTLACPRSHTESQTGFNLVLDPSVLGRTKA